MRFILYSTPVCGWGACPDGREPSFILRRRPVKKEEYSAGRNLDPRRDAAGSIVLPEQRASAPSSDVESALDSAVGLTVSAVKSKFGKPDKSKPPKMKGVSCVYLISITLILTLSSSRWYFSGAGYKGSLKILTPPPQLKWGYSLFGFGSTLFLVLMVVTAVPLHKIAAAAAEAARQVWGHLARRVGAAGGAASHLAGPRSPYTALPGIGMF